jgi:hypothetical protein
MRQGQGQGGRDRPDSYDDSSEEDVLSVPSTEPDPELVAGEPGPADETGSDESGRSVAGERGPADETG